MPEPVVLETEAQLARRDLVDLQVQLVVKGHLAQPDQLEQLECGEPQELVPPELADLLEHLGQVEQLGFREPQELGLLGSTVHLELAEQLGFKEQVVLEPLELMGLAELAELAEQLECRELQELGQPEPVEPRASRQAFSTTTGQR